MGLFDFFKKKSNKDNDSSSDVEDNSIELENDDSALGWDAITEEFERIYPEQQDPKHYGTLIKYFMGGPDPLDGISVYDAGEFWHFISYGLTELYAKESEDLEYSGFGFEFTFKLKKSGGDDEKEILSVCSNLQKLARYVFESGNVIGSTEYIYTRQEEGIDAKQMSKLTGFITASDDLVSTISTPYGQVSFITLIGATDAELKAIYESDNSKELIKELQMKLGNQLTDYHRESLI
ncbi:TPA: suppressor of fused domain protein [Streptococcus suis]|nr:suppressor of fused domain protein [Streptococcus suis]